MSKPLRTEGRDSNPLEQRDRVMTTDFSPLWISLRTAGLATIVTFVPILRERLPQSHRYPNTIAGCGLVGVAE